MHSPTLLLLLAILLGILALAQTVSWLFGHKTPAQVFWAGAYLSAFLSAINILNRSYIPDVLSILGTQATQFLTAYLILMGARCYIGQRPWPIHFGVLIIVALMSVATFFTLFDPNPPARIVISTLVTGLFFGFCAITIAKGDIRRLPARYVFALLCGLHAVFVFSRLGFIYQADDQVISLAQGAMIPPFFILETIIFLVLIAFAMQMLINETMTNELRKLAEIDPLTNTFNRRSFMMLMDKAVSAANRRQTLLSIFLIDLDHFKQINDKYGHGAGDDALCYFVAIASSCLRKEDVLGRIGGEEFAAFLPNARLVDAQLIAERLRSTVAERPFNSAHGTIPLTISIGITQCLPEESLEVSLQRADKAMYRAKEGGRNRIELWNASYIT